MKLLCLTGVHQDTLYPLSPPGLSLGRESDNDIALDDGEASRYHAKIQLIDDIWYAIDNQSTNGVRLNGKLIDGKAPLSLNDTVRIGTTEFRVVDDAYQPVASTPPAGEAVSAPKRRLLPVILLGLLLAILLALIAGVLLAPAEQAMQPPAVVDLSKQPLALFYERVETGPDRVFRYELSLTDRELSVIVDDAINRTRVEEAIALDEDQIDLLRSSLVTDEFLSSDSTSRDQQGQRSVRDRLMIRAGPVGNYLVVANTARPPAMEQAIMHLTQFVQAELGIFAETMPRSEVIAKAREYFERGQRLQSDAAVETSNLYQALLAYRHVLERLKWLEDKPAFYEQAKTAFTRISEQLEEQLADLEREAMTFRNTGQLEEARQRYMTIVNTWPDRENEYVRRARREIIQIDDELKKQRRNR